MTAAATIQASKTEREENFPVASWLITPRLRAPVLSFYRFARAADDIADHPSLADKDKFAGLDNLEKTLLGKSDTAKAALPLRAVLAERGLPPVHPLDLLTAFRTDVTKRRYANWSELMHYCRYSAMPVGRFVLALHGESETAWTYSDPLCAALQVINHLQDCGKDYRALDRVYLPLDMLGARGAKVEDLAADKASPELRAALRDIAEKTKEMMPAAEKLPLSVKDGRLGLETGVIVRLAQKLLTFLTARDPLNERVHLTKPEMAVQGLRAMAATAAARRTRAVSARSQQR
ncbi:MAG TPA: squalene synthase HpnC [Methyloceanibacter sp.]|nr:squalene synthase HpnC [Methyloceanibacter sp.]